MSGKPKRTGSSSNSFNMWVSTNKVLIGSVGGAKKQHSRNPNFESEETRLLITLWGDPQVQQALATTHKKQPVIAKLANKMKEYGYNRSTEEVNTRIKNLKCVYNRIKKDMETGVVTSWKHFEALDKIMTRQQNTDSEAGSSSTKKSTDQVEVKIETLSDDEKDIRTDELLKNAEQVELKEPNLLIPKDEPMDQDNDEDPNDPDFENDGDDEEDSCTNNDSDESDFDIDNERRKARLRRRTSRKPTKSNANKKTKTSTAATSTATTTSTTAPIVTPVVTPSSTQTPNTIKIINYTGNSGLNISKIVPHGNVIQPASAPNVAIVSAAPSTTTTSSTAGKISLVPTNFLLKQQPSNINFNSPIQLYTKPTVSVSNSVTSMPVCSVQSSQSTGQPMKLILVNTANGQNQQIQIPAGKQIYTTTSTPIVKATQGTQISLQPKPIITSAGSLLPIPQKKPDPPPPLAATITPVQPKQNNGLRSVLNQLVTLQKESLAISRSRMNVERERLNNEKHIACSLVEALNDLNNMLHNYSNVVNIGDDYGFGSSTFQQRNSSAGENDRDSTMHDISQRDISPARDLIPVIDTIKAEVISDSD
ncbi:rho GTPase-activating protein gacF-like [Uranotaenia lowii]|uniref:rho GTPase-activating protein gacF-like n=1 Tax=Uranotaenia lowii TaxID=190385 RepID=UPI00247912A6|nr:rho GTPase-activating protein gacF-like [Uranotaenia lowii]